MVKPVKKKRIVKDPEVRKREILAIAKKLFVELGYEATSVGRITKEAGVAHGTFYWYFPSKADALIALANDYGENIISQTSEIEELDVEPLEAIEAAIDTIIASTLRDRDLVVLFHLSLSVGEHLTLEASWMDRLAKPLIGAIERGIEDDSVTTSSPRITAYLIVNLISQTLHDSIISGKSDKIEEIIPALKEFILNALTA